MADEGFKRKLFRFAVAIDAETGFSLPERQLKRRPATERDEVHVPNVSEHFDLTCAGAMGGAHFLDAQCLQLTDDIFHRRIVRIF